MNKPKLFARFRHGHLINCGFRVDLQESGEEFSKLNESVCFEILEASKDKLKVKLWHLVYEENGRGNQAKDSWGLYEIDLTKNYKEDNVTYLGEDK